MRCETCGHFVNLFPMSLEHLYSYDYVQATYGGEEGIVPAFGRIMALLPEESDNFGRVWAIHQFWRDHKDKVSAGWGQGKLLDIGTGLAVFPAKMVELGWRDITAIDVDGRLIAHAVEYVGVRGVVKDWVYSGDEIGRQFDLITMNQVVEHFDMPVSFLAKAREHLKPGGVVYLEVPDGEVAFNFGAEREEFFLDHRCAFSMASFCLLADKAGFRVEMAERVKQPSGKFTIRGFLYAKIGG